MRSAKVVRVVDRERNPFRGVRIGLGALALVLVVGTVGYLFFGFGLLDAVFQTVITVTTVGFNSPHPLDGGSKAFTIILILVGVGTALYTFSAVLEVLIDGHMRDLIRRRKMERDIDWMQEHVIVCGWGRVGREVARFLAGGKTDLVVIDRDPERLRGIPYAFVCGDIADDETLLLAGLNRAAAVVAALDTDADNLYCDRRGQVDVSGHPDHRPGSERVLGVEAGPRRSRQGGEPSAAWGRSNGIVRDSAARSRFRRRRHA